MATSGTNYTAKWELEDGILTISPVSGNSGIMRPSSENYIPQLTDYINMSDAEIAQVEKIAFRGSVKFQCMDFLGSYSDYTNLALFLNGFRKITSIDVSGLNTSSIFSFASFLNIPTLVELIGLSNLDTSSATNYAAMFEECKLASIDVSSFSNLNTAIVLDMFKDTSYCTEIVLPSYFYRADAGESAEGLRYRFGLVPAGKTATNENGITIATDEDFFALDDQDGTWTRDVSGSASLMFSVNKVEREANDVTVNYTYATGTTATASLYLKESGSSSYPSTPASSFTLNGSGNASETITVTSDSAYDMKIIVTDGETTMYTFPSVDSNVLLLEVDDIGNLTATGDVVSYGNIDCGGQLEVGGEAIINGEFYLYLDSVTDANLISAITALGWASDVIV